MTLVTLQNILILSAALVCLVVYLTAVLPSTIRALSVILFSAAAVGAAGTAVCTAAAENRMSAAIILGAAAVCIAILMISFAVGHSRRTAVLRLCLAPLWAMLIALLSYAVSAVNDSSAVMRALGFFTSLIMALPAACDFLRLYIEMKNDGSVSHERKAHRDVRKLKSVKRKSASKKRKKLKDGKRK